MKVVAVRAEHGKVVESYVFEANIEETVKDIVRQILDEWDPDKSDLLITKEVHTITVVGEEEQEVIRELEERELVEREGGSIKASIPIYYINFDVDLEEEEGMVINKLYIVAPLVSKEFKYEIEKEAASITSPSGEEGPRGIEVE